MVSKSKLIGAVVGLAALSAASQAGASLMGDTVYVNGNPYVVGSGPVTYQDGWLPLGTDDNVTLDMGASWITLSMYAPDLVFFWNYSDGGNITLSLTDLDWNVPGAYIESISWTASGDAQSAGLSASLVSGSAIDISIPGDFLCGSANCGEISISITAYEPEVPVPASIPEPATLALFGLSLAGMGLARRRKSA